jgi:hypothetical protein
VLARYLTALRTTVASSATPYGYTLTIWTSGAVLTHARGVPSTAEALLFLVGAVAGYGLSGVVAFGGLQARLHREEGSSVLWGGLHLLSVGLAIAVVSGVAHLVENSGAWPLGGFVGTTLYLGASALQLSLAHRPGEVP